MVPTLALVFALGTPSPQATPGVEPTLADVRDCVDILRRTPDLVLLHKEDVKRAIVLRFNLLKGKSTAAIRAGIVHHLTDTGTWSGGRFVPGMARRSFS